MTDMFEPQCGIGHPIEIVSEGYGVCHDPEWQQWFAWRFTPPSVGRWWSSSIRGRDGQPVTAWRGFEKPSKAEALAYIQEDMDAHRALPFDEERERARLVEVAR